jgi:hypothetical protein
MGDISFRRKDQEDDPGTVIFGAMVHALLRGFGSVIFASDIMKSRFISRFIF